MSLETKPTNASLHVDRKRFVVALDRVRAVVPRHCPKAVLSGVLLDSSGGHVQLAATDGDIRLRTQVEAEGTLSPCVVDCAELLRRIKASKDDTVRLTVRARSNVLVLNGGRVEHTLPTLPAEEFPPVPDRHDGESLTVDAAELRLRLTAVSHAMARDPSRYAINGLLLESDDQGVRFVATDGRRLAIAAFAQCATAMRGQAIIPARVTTLIQKLAAREADSLVIAVKSNTTDGGEKTPADIYVAGADWLLHSQELDGFFPIYRDVVPRSHSRFVADRRALIETLAEIALTTSIAFNVVRVDLTPRRIRLSTKSPESGTSSASLAARFIGGDDREIHTAFNPAYLLNALKALDGDEAVLDIDQNGLGVDGHVFGKPALLYTHNDESVRFVVMPVSAQLEPTRANLGSNYREDAA